MKQLTDDIYISKQIEPHHYTRVAIFYGDTPVDEKNMDGSVEFLSSKEDYYQHYDYITSLLKARFLSDEYIQQSLKKNAFNPLKTFANFCEYIPKQYGILLFFDQSDLIEDFPQTDGTFFAHHITEKQYQTLNQYQAYFNEFYQFDFEFPYPESSLLGTSTRTYLTKVKKLIRAKK